MSDDQVIAADLPALRRMLPALPPTSHPRRWLGGPLALGALLLWATAWRGAWLAPTSLQGVLLAMGAGTLAGMLVILGHDAAHGSLTPWRAVNGLLARLLFLPAWQTASGWQQAHRRHHAHTNLKQLDDGYPPLSPEDWRRAGPWRRVLLRIATSLPGLFMFYGAVWWRHVIWPRRPDRGRWLRFRLDSLLVIAFVAFLSWLSLTQDGLVGLLVLVVGPFVLSNWWISAITLQQHRHPRVRWFDDDEAWSQWRGQVAGTVHLRWPGWCSWGLFNIFEHTAHHVDPRLPFTALRPTQRALESLLPAEVLVVDDPAPWRLAHLRRVLRECQLYDYDAECWLRFSEVSLDPGACRDHARQPATASNANTTYSSTVSHSAL